MIKLTKLEEPDILKQNAVAWTQVLLAKVAAGEKPTEAEKARYRHAEIKKVLIKETNGKCAYCESKLLHIVHGDIEHIVPKSTKIEVTFEWGNLTLACDVCNTNKGDKFSGGTGFIDPYMKDPADHFVFIGPLVFGKPGNTDARLTEEVLRLNRAELVERRAQRIGHLRENVEVIRRSPDNLRPLLLQALQEELASDKEYSAVARGCIAPLLA
jgi:uncharacterized protein (TIGR02646 family)